MRWGQTFGFRPQLARSVEELSDVAGWRRFQLKAASRSVEEATHGSHHASRAGFDFFERVFHARIFHSSPRHVVFGFHVPVYLREHDDSANHSHVLPYLVVDDDDVHHRKTVHHAGERERGLVRQEFRGLEVARGNDCGGDRGVFRDEGLAGFDDGEHYWSACSCGGGEVVELRVGHDQFARYCGEQGGFSFVQRARVLFQNRAFADNGGGERACSFCVDGVGFCGLPSDCVQWAGGGVHFCDDGDGGVVVDVCDVQERRAGEREPQLMEFKRGRWSRVERGDVGETDEDTEDDYDDDTEEGK